MASKGDVVLSYGCDEDETRAHVIVELERWHGDARLAAIAYSDANPGVDVETIEAAIRECVAPVIDLADIDPVAYLDTDGEGRGALYWIDGRIRCRTATSDTDAGVECARTNAESAIEQSWGAATWGLTWASDE